MLQPTSKTLFAKDLGNPGYTPPFMNRDDLREYATDAIKFWEPWRLIYNLNLAAIVILYFAIGYPLFATLLNRTERD